MRINQISLNTFVSFQAIITYLLTRHFTTMYQYLIEKDAGTRQVLT